MFFLNPFSFFTRKRLKSFRYKNLTLLAVSLVIAAHLYNNESFHSFLLQLGSYGYIGAFIAGFFFVSVITAATSIIVLLVLAERLSAVEIGLIAGIGAVIGDLVIFHVIKDNLTKEVEPIYKQFGGGHITKLLHSRYFSWTLPVIGTAIIASPLPDEIGISLLGLSKLKTYQFLALTFILNSIGIIILITTSQFIKP